MILALGHADHLDVGQGRLAEVKGPHPLQHQCVRPAAAVEVQGRQLGRIDPDRVVPGSAGDLGDIGVQRQVDALVEDHPYPGVAGVQGHHAGGGDLQGVAAPAVAGSLDHGARQGRGRLGGGPGGAEQHRVARRPHDDRVGVGVEILDQQSGLAVGGEGEGAAGGPQVHRHQPAVAGVEAGDAAPGDVQGEPPRSALQQRSGGGGGGLDRSQPGAAVDRLGRTAQGDQVGASAEVDHVAVVRAVEGDARRVGVAGAGDPVQHIDRIVMAAGQPHGGIGRGDRPGLVLAFGDADHLEIGQARLVEVDSPRPPDRQGVRPAAAVEHKPRQLGRGDADRVVAGRADDMGHAGVQGQVRRLVQQHVDPGVARIQGRDAAAGDLEGNPAPAVVDPGDEGAGEGGGGLDRAAGRLEVDRLGGRAEDDGVGR